MSDETEDEFIRRWSGRAHDEATLRAIEAIYEHLIDYALHAWRPMSIEPPVDTMLITECVEGVVLMTINAGGDWRTNLGQPHKPPTAWMRAPIPNRNRARSK